MRLQYQQLDSPVAETVSQTWSLQITYYYESLVIVINDLLGTHYTYNNYYNYYHC